MTLKEAVERIEDLLRKEPPTSWLLEMECWSHDEIQQRTVGWRFWHHRDQQNVQAETLEELVAAVKSLREPLNLASKELEDMPCAKTVTPSSPSAAGPSAAPTSDTL